MIDFRDFAGKYLLKSIIKKYMFIFFLELLLSLYIKGENEITTAGSLSGINNYIYIINFFFIKICQEQILFLLFRIIVLF